jgi:hypothetical protein
MKLVRIAFLMAVVLSLSAVPGVLGGQPPAGGVSHSSGSVGALCDYDISCNNGDSACCSGTLAHCCNVCGALCGGGCSGCAAQ